jgi:hypothetical protein
MVRWHFSTGLANEAMDAERSWETVQGDDRESPVPVNNRIGRVGSR